MGERQSMSKDSFDDTTSPYTRAQTPLQWVQAQDTMDSDVVDDESFIDSPNTTQRVFTMDAAILRTQQRQQSSGRSMQDHSRRTSITERISTTSRMDPMGTRRKPNAVSWDDHVLPSPTTEPRNASDARVRATNVHIRRRLHHDASDKSTDLPADDVRDLEFEKKARMSYLHMRFKMNSYFALRLSALAVLLLAMDICGLFHFYTHLKYEAFLDDDPEDASGNHKAVRYVGEPMSRMFFSWSSTSCRSMVAAGSIIYHLLPCVIILGLPSSGFHIFEPFKRERRIDASGRLQKVKRTLFLQVCEVAGIIVLLFTILLAIRLIFFLAGSKWMEGCGEHNDAYIFVTCAAIVLLLMLLQIRFFMRFREHLKMQLGAFKESDQTGDVRRLILRNKLARRKKQRAQSKNDPSESNVLAPKNKATPPKSQVVSDIRKRLYRGAQLGDLRLLKRSLRIATKSLGEEFARELYPDAKLVFGLFAWSRKNPMHVAAYQGNLAALELLNNCGLSVNSFDKVSRLRVSTGDLFWFLASRLVCKPVVEVEESNSSVLRQTLVTPLHCAVSTGRLDAVRWLLARGADVNACSRSSYRSESKLPPIFLADHPEIVRELLAAGANHLAIPDPGHANTVTVLQMAYLRGNYAVAQVLEEWGGDIALTPLHSAAAKDDENAIRLLLRKKVEPDCLGEIGYVGLNERTPLHWAAVNGSVKAVDMLLEAGANVDARDARGRTPLHWAARVNKLEVVTSLLEQGAKGDLVDDSDMTPIVCAACSGAATPAMIKALSSHGCKVNHQLKSSGDTALHLAVKLDDRETALALLDAGADIMCTNKEGLRAIDCTTSTRLQFELKRAAGNRDVMISYTHSHLEFAQKLRASLEAANITTWLDLMDPNGIGGGAVWREEIARGISNAAVVLCILTEDYKQSKWCLNELAMAKQVGTPILAISTEGAEISEELQVYLYTRQIVPFEGAIKSVEHHANVRGVRYTYDEGEYQSKLRTLLDGLRDEIEKKRSRVPNSNSVLDNQSFLPDSISSNHELVPELKRIEQGTVVSSGSNVSSQTTATSSGDLRKNSTAVSDKSNSDHNCGSIVMNDEGYVRYRPKIDRVESVPEQESSVQEWESIPNRRKMKAEEQEQAMISYADLPTNKEQFVFIAHGDRHASFVRKLCGELCRQAGVLCYVDRRRKLNKLQSHESIPETALSSGEQGNQDMSNRIREAKEAILKCSMFVLVLSRKTLKSELLKDQLAFAEDKGKRILPVVADELELPLDLQYSLSRAQFFHFFIKNDFLSFPRSFESLLSAVKNHVQNINEEGQHASRSVTSSFLSSTPIMDEDAQSTIGGSFLATSDPAFLSIQTDQGGSGRRRRRSFGSDFDANTSTRAFGLSQSFLSGTTRSQKSLGTSELSLGQSMLGTFSTLSRRGIYIDDLEEAEEEFDDEKYAQLLGEDASDEEEFASFMDSRESGNVSLTVHEEESLAHSESHDL